MCDFQPESLITSVKREIKDRFAQDLVFESNKLPKIVYGDELRVRYILASLVKHSYKRSKKFHDMDQIKISASVNDNKIVDFNPSEYSDEENEINYVLVIQISD